jgi:hypothetical protein
VQGVDLAQVIVQPPGERIAAQAAQAVFVVQLAEDDGRGGIYVLREEGHGALAPEAGRSVSLSLAQRRVNALADTPMTWKNWVADYLRISQPIVSALATLAALTSATLGDVVECQ